MTLQETIDEIWLGILRHDLKQNLTAKEMAAKYGVSVRKMYELAAGRAIFKKNRKGKSYKSKEYIKINLRPNGRKLIAIHTSAIQRCFPNCARVRIIEMDGKIVLEKA